MAGGVANNIDNVVPVKARKTTSPAKTAKPQIATTNGSTERVLISWSAPNFDYFEKNVWWYLAAGVIVLGIVGYFAWSRDWFSTAVILVVAFVLFWYVATARPHEENYTITPFGIQTEKRYVPFSEIHSYSILYTPKVKKINFILSKKYLPAMTLDISNLDPHRLQAVLSSRVPEDQARGENILDTLARWLRI